MLWLKSVDRNQRVIFADVFSGKIQKFVIIRIDWPVDKEEFVLFVFGVDQGPDGPVLFDFASDKVNKRHEVLFDVW